MRYHQSDRHYLSDLSDPQKSTNSANFVQYLEFQYQHQSELKSVYVLYFSEFSFIHQIDIIITVQKMYLFLHSSDLKY